MKSIIKSKLSTRVALVASLCFSFQGSDHSIFWQHKRSTHRTLVSLGCSTEGCVEGNAGQGWMTQT